MLVVRCLLAVALIAGVMYLATGTAEYRATWDEPSTHQRFSFVLPELVWFGALLLLIPLMFALYPRRWTNILFWVYAIYLLFPWLDVVFDDSHAVNRTMAGWFALQGVAVFSLGSYTLWKAANDRKRLVGGPDA